jgi:4-hydroxybenzoate polyprenyltransferase
MKPTLTPAHGTALATTSGITSVISLVIALSVLGQCGGLSGGNLALAVCAALALFLGAGALYAARNQVGRALDSASGNPKESTIAAARALVRFHCGMAGVFAGCGFAAAFRLPLAESPAVAIAPAGAFALAVAALVQAASWVREAGRRKRE